MLSGRDVKVLSREVTRFDRITLPSGLKANSKRRDVSTIVQAKDDGGPSQSGSCRDGEDWWEYRNAFMVKLKESVHRVGQGEQEESRPPQLWP